MESNKSSILLSIVIPAFNAADFIDSLIASFLKVDGDKARCELLIVNDGSTDKTVEKVVEWKIAYNLNYLTLIHTEGVGPGQAREIGALHARADWVALVDSDEQFGATWLEAAYTFIDNSSGYGGCEGVVEICDYHKISLFSHQTRSLAPGRYLTANLILRRSLVKFCKCYTRKFYFREDSDLAFQLLETGQHIAHSPRLLMYHPPIQGDWKKPLRLAQRYQYDGLLASRFPSRYWRTVDAHNIIGLSVPHARLLILVLSCLLQLLALSLVATRHPGLWAMAALSLTLSLILSLVPISTYLPLSPKAIINNSISQFPLATLVYMVVPWIVIFSWAKGFWKYRHVPPFTESTS
jgi:glycosyltransferase involved in cell wall biosynthesis